MGYSVQLYTPRILKLMNKLLCVYRSYYEVNKYF